jgi:hypothetical protein
VTSHGHRQQPDHGGFAQNRRLVVSMLVAAVLWFGLLRAMHIHEEAPRTHGDQVGLCDLCAQLGAPAGVLAAPPTLAWFAVWSVIAFVVSSLGAASSRPHTYQARAPPRS